MCTGFNWLRMESSSGLGEKLTWGSQMYFCSHKCRYDFGIRGFVGRCSCNVVTGYQRFGGLCCLHLQGMTFMAREALPLFYCFNLTTKKRNCSQADSSYGFPRDVWILSPHIGDRRDSITRKVTFRSCSSTLPPQIAFPVIVVRTKIKVK
jgi:hypothetical protein